MGSGGRISAQKGLSRWKPRWSDLSLGVGYLSFHHLRKGPEWYPYGPRDPQTVGECVGLRGPKSRGMERGNNLKEGREGLLLTFSLFCDFYQNTEIQHTHKPAQKRSALFTAAAGTAHRASRLQGGVGEGLSHSSRERKRGRKRQKEKPVGAEKPRGE